MSASRPKSDSHDDLLDWAIHELAAQWDGTAKRLAIVNGMEQTPFPVASWMTRSEAADHTLRFAQNFATTDPNTKVTLERMATEMINPSAAGRLQVSLISRDEASLGELDAKGLAEINQRGASPEAVKARKQFIAAQAHLMAECVASSKARGEPTDAGVIIIADPADPRAATTAHLINSVISRRTGQDFGEMPVVVLSRIAKAKALFEKLRPKLVSWLDVPPPPRAIRVICMAHGGETCTTGKLDLPQRP